MKIKGILIILFIAIFSISTYAHPPKKIEIKYNKKDKTLKVVVLHKVKNTNAHYISLVKIIVNGEDRKVRTPKTQSKKEFHKVIVKLKDIKKGDKVTIIAKCNKFGKKSKNFIIK